MRLLLPRPASQVKFDNYPHERWALRKLDVIEAAVEVAQGSGQSGDAEDMDKASAEDSAADEREEDGGSHAAQLVAQQQALQQQLVDADRRQQRLQAELEELELERQLLQLQQERKALLRLQQEQERQKHGALPPTPPDVA